MSDIDDFTSIINHKVFKRYAITSYAVVVYTLIDNQIHYLLGQIRDTIPFKEFIRCRIKDDEIKHYMQHMTLEEKNRLLRHDFVSLVKDVFLYSRLYKNTMDLCPKFEESVKKFTGLLQNSDVGLTELPWIFPKGRKKNALEGECRCALRELAEETHITSDKISICELEPIEEMYYGLNGQRYKTVYFVGFIDHDVFSRYKAYISSKATHTSYRTTLSDEMNAMGFFSYEEAYRKLDHAKQCVLKMINSHLLFYEVKPPKLDRRNSI